MKIIQTSREALPMAAIEASQPGQLSIDVLGGLRLGQGEATLPLPNRKARAILAYLALEAAPAIARERLAGLFWSESSERHARSSLRQTLFEVREVLKGFGIAALRTGREDVSLDRASIALDLDAALDAIAAGALPARLLSADSGPEMLLAGYEDLSPSFADWLATARAAALAKMLRALERGYSDPAHDHAQRRQIAEAALRLDPLHEAACRMVMQLAAEDGETGVALRAYATLYERMDTELDMEPSDATQALVARIKQGLVEARATPAVIGRTVAPRLVPGGVPIVAVLPLLASSDDGMAGWIAGGVAEDLVGMLASLREPMVISANSTRHLTGHNLDLRTIAAQLGAHYVVTGSVRVAGGRGRIAVELAEASNGAALWGQAFTFTEDSIFETQAVIAANIANALAPQVNAAELRRSKGQLPDDMGAYHLLLQARDRIFRLDREGFDEAGGMLAEAVRRDPGYSGAHAARADWFSLRVFQGWSADIGRDVAALMDAAQEAIRLDPLNARALALYAHNLMLAHGRNDDALALLDRSLAAAPNDAEALIWSGPTLAYSDHTTQAIDRCERALLLSPSDPFLFRYQHFMSIAHYCAGNFSQSAAFGLRAHTENPNYISNLKVTIAALCGAGRTHEIPNLMRCLLKLQPDFSVNAMLARKLFHDDTKQARMRRDLLSVGLPP